MIENYRPQLYPNDAVKIEDIRGEYLASAKLDGVRCIIADGHIMSRSASDAGDKIPLKRIQSKSIVSRLQSIADLAKENNILLDGELYAHGMNFNEISGHVRRIDGEAPSAIQFHAFDAINMNVPNGQNIGAYERSEMLNSFVSMAWELYGLRNIYYVNQIIVREPSQIIKLLDDFTAKGFEGAILKRVDSPYKFGRITTKSGMGLKIKPYMTFDAQVVSIEEATEVDEDADKTIDSFGRSHTSKKMDDRIPCGKAAAFGVMYNGFPSKVTLAMTDEEKIYIFNHPKEFIGRWIEFKGMLVGSKDRVRHPVFTRFRGDLDE